MTAADSMLPADAREGSPFAPAPPSRWAWIDGKLSWLSEFVNPILVKETRQALKSRQFLITFSLLLIAGWGWSLWVVSIFFPDIYYAPQGPFMLAGYHCILCLPLIVIVPFSAFRSLSAEREDGTYDLVSITTLRPRQIIGGKLGSAVVQMLIYLSALSPAMTFTYMLRGIDILMILMLLFYLFLASVVLSVIGLMLATVTQSRQWQMVLGVIFILCLAFLFFMASFAGIGAVTEGVMLYDESLFWAIQAFVVSIVVGYSAMFYLAAMARITFVSDNRSTRIRLCLCVIQALAVAWTCYFWLSEGDEWVLTSFLMWSAFHWWLMGALMVGETTEISPRIRRNLPVTFIGRAFSIWLYPGPGTGYVLMATCCGCVVALIMAASVGSSITGSLSSAAIAVQGSVLWRLILLGVIVLFCLGGGLFVYRARNQPTAVALLASFFFAIAAGLSLLFLIATLIPAHLHVDEDVALFALVIYCHLVIYLGLTRLAMMLFDRFVQGGVFLSALLSILLVLCGTFIPIIVQLLLKEMLNQQYFEYTALQTFNPILSPFAAHDNRLTDVTIAGLTVPIEAVLLVLGASVMLLVNLLLAAREIDRQREETPDRVLEEERALHPSKVALDKPSSPWDEPTGTVEAESP